MRRREKPYDRFKRLYQHRYELRVPAGGCGAERFRRLHDEASEIAPDRHASWATAEPPDRTAFIFLFDRERDAFAKWVET
jgi:hypothetical protein